MEKTGIMGSTENTQKIGIVNHWMVNNYGALFLAYALEKKLIQMGYHVESISYLPDEVANPWNTSIIKKIGIITYIKRLIYFLVYVKPREKAFKKFRSLLHVSKTHYSDASFPQISNKYDTIVIGGDQLWNCKINYYNANNFLPFINEPSRKVVYAASLAQDKMRSGFENEFSKLAGSFGYITAREQTGAEIIQELTGREVPVILDPAFLLKESEWDALCEKKVPPSKRFLFMYQVQMDTELIDFAKRIAKEKGLQIIVCSFPHYKYIGCKFNPFISPERWLFYMRHADYVVTDAFHGTVFSIIFQKDFTTYLSSYGKDTGSRITDLLKTYHLQNRLLSCGACDTGSIDYCPINSQIIQQRKEAERHINMMLHLENRKTDA